MATIYFSSARSTEDYKSSGGAVGDQRQTSSPDYSGEVSSQPFYVHSKGWYVLRLKNHAYASKLAEIAWNAVNNANIGYDQGNRLGIIKYGTKTKTKTECDCSSLMRQCIKEATGKDIGNFTTYNMVKYCEQSGLFETAFKYKTGTVLYNGDILCTCTSGHTGAITRGAKSRTSYYPKYTGSSNSLVDALTSVGVSDTSKKNRTAIANANGMSVYAGTASQNAELLSLLKAGKLIMA